MSLPSIICSEVAVGAVAGGTETAGGGGTIAQPAMEAFSLSRFFSSDLMNALTVSRKLRFGLQSLAEMGL
jgi:hypothetical protein